MVADACGNPCRHLGGRNLHNAVPEGCTFPAGHCDACIRQKQPIGTQNLAKLPFAHILGIYAVIVDNRPEPRTGKADFRPGVFALDIISMQCRSQGIPAKVRQPQKGGKSHPTHTATQCPLLGIKTIRPHPFVPCQMQLLVFFQIISLLKDSHIVRAALMEILVFIRIDRVNLQPHVTEILPCQPACPANILKAALATAFPGQQQDFLHAAAGNHLHLMLHLLTGQLHPLNVVIAVEAAVDAVILAVICQI